MYVQPVGRVCVFILFHVCVVCVCVCVCVYVCVCVCEICSGIINTVQYIGVFERVTCSRRER